jgi:hypothetical protein
MERHANVNAEFLRLPGEVSENVRIGARPELVAFAWISEFAEQSMEIAKLLQRFRLVRELDPDPLHGGAFPAADRVDGAFLDGRSVVPGQLADVERLTVGANVVLHVDAGQLGQFLKHLAGGHDGRSRRALLGLSLSLKYRLLQLMDAGCNLNAPQ